MKSSFLAVNVPGEIQFELGEGWKTPIPTPTWFKWCFLGGNAFFGGSIKEKNLDWMKFMKISLHEFTLQCGVHTLMNPQWDSPPFPWIYEISLMSKQWTYFCWHNIFSVLAFIRENSFKKYQSKGNQQFHLYNGCLNLRWHLSTLLSELKIEFRIQHGGSIGQTQTLIKKSWS